MQYNAQDPMYQTASITADGTQNATINRDAPITGGKQEVIINTLQVRQAIRQKQDISTYLSAIAAAESRYFPNRTYLYDLYIHSLLDSHLFGTVQKRMNSVLNKPLFYKNAQGEVIEAMTNVIQSREFREVMQAIMESVLWGISGLEFIPGQTIQSRPIPRKHIKTKTQQIAAQQNQINGIDYTVLDNVWVIGRDEDLGVLLPAAMYVIYKRNAVADWANFIEIFGIPIRIAKYDAFDKATQTALKDALDNAGSAMSLMIPKQAEFVIEDGKTANANGDLQLQFVQLMNEAISIIILGNTDTTNASKSGSLAKAKVHSTQQDEIIKADMALLVSYLNDPHFTKILQSYGLPVIEGGNFEFNKDIDIAFLAQRAEVDKILVEAGLPISTKYFYETYNIPAPEPGDVLVTAPTSGGRTPLGAGVNEPTSPTTTPIGAGVKDIELRNQLPEGHKEGGEYTSGVRTPLGAGVKTDEYPNLSDLIQKSIADFFAQAL